MYFTIKYLLFLLRWLCVTFYWRIFLLVCMKPAAPDLSWSGVWATQSWGKGLCTAPPGARCHEPVFTSSAARRTSCHGNCAACAYKNKSLTAHRRFSRHPTSATPSSSSEGEVGRASSDRQEPRRVKRWAAPEPAATRLLPRASRGTANPAEGFWRGSSPGGARWTAGPSRRKSCAHRADTSRRRMCSDCGWLREVWASLCRLLLNAPHHD